MMPMDIEGTAETIEGNRPRHKHVGKLEDSNASVAVLFRTVPNEPENCLVIGPKFLDDIYHNSFMKALESAEGQSSFELGKHIAKSRFPDGVQMLQFLHEKNFIKKVSTNRVMMTFGAGNGGEVKLDELNKLIAKQKGISLKELSLLEQETTEAKPTATTEKAEDKKEVKENAAKKKTSTKK